MRGTPSTEHSPESRTSDEPPSEEQVFALLRGVIDPELGSDIVELGMAKAVTVDSDGLVDVTIALTTSGCPLRAQIQRDVRARVGSLPGVSRVHLTWSELTQEEKAATMAKARWNVSQNAPDTEIPATTKVLMSAVRNGVGRETAHEAIKEAAVGTALSMRQGQAENDVFAKLAADERLTQGQLEALVAEPISFTGAAVAQVQAVVRAVEALCERHPAAAAYSPGAIL